MSHKDDAEPVESDKADDGTNEKEKDSVEYDTGLGDTERVMRDGEPAEPGKIKRFFAGYWRKKKWTLPLTFLSIVGIISVVPATRYPLLAAAGVKRQFAVVVWDSKTDTPVSGARVTLDGTTHVTDDVGGAFFTLKVGSGTLTVSKQYYRSFSENVFVGVTHKSANVRAIHLIATGRQVPIIVVNQINGKPIQNAEISVLDTEAKTDLAGKATIVLPTGSATRLAAVTAGGYNDLSAGIQVTSQPVAANTFKLTPSGRVYFLSNLSGNIDVVSTNLDGTGRQTVLAGTGSEDPNNTVLLASRDWKYLALLSKRDGGQNAKLFLINTSNNQVTTIAEDAATFTPLGWSGHYFVYLIDRTDVQAWQPNQSALKSYDAETGDTAVLDQTSAQGTSADYISQSIGTNYGTQPGVYLTGNSILYSKQWNGPNGTDLYGGSLKLSGMQDQIMSISPDGSNKQVLKSISTPANGGYLNLFSAANKPDDIYFEAETYNNGLNDVYYEYLNGAVTQSNTITNETFTQTQQNHATYLESPSGSQTFWSEQRDGKNTLLVGDVNGGGSNQVASPSDYIPYGWYTDDYLLVEKNGSELYVMPAGGGSALKISDYYKPSQSLYGYGGGYGGQ